MRELPLVWAAGVLLKGTVLLLLVLLVTVALRRASAGLRHLIWSAGIAVLLLLPVVSLTLPWKLPVAATPLVLEPAPLPAPSAPAVSTTDEPAAGPSAAPALAAAASHPETRGSRLTWGRVIVWLLGLWIAGAVAFLGRLALGAVVVRRIVSRAVPLDAPDWTRPLLEGADRLSLDAVPRLVVSDRLPMPFACGVLQPVIVLPESSREWSDRRRRAVLYHELAHLRRLDLPVNALGQLACAIYWFHPLVWMAARRLRMESERACDDLVLGAGTRASEYADHLLQIVCGAARARTPAVAVPMAERREFEGRMLAILERDARRDAPGRRQAVTLAAFALALLLPLAALGPATRRAQQQPGAVDQPRAQGPVERQSQSRKQSDQASRQPGQHTAQETRQETVEQTDIQGPQGKQPRPDRMKVRTNVWNTQAGQGADPKVVAALLAALADSVVSVREDAAYALGELEAKEAVVGLSARLTREPDAQVRKMIAWALGQIESREATEPLGRAAQTDASPEVRETAVWALGQIEDPAAVPALEAVLRDQSEELRGQAAWALGTIEPSSAPAGLIAALKDSSPEVRVRAAWALGRIEDGAAATALLPLLKDAVPEVRKAAFWALGAIGGEAAQPALIEALKDPDPDVRAAAARALAGGHQSPWPWPMPRPIIK